MTVITAEEALKSRQNFSDFIESKQDEIEQEYLKEYSKRELVLSYAQLTPTCEGLMNALNEFRDNQKVFLFLYIVNEKPEITKFIKYLNNTFNKMCGIFLVKAILNGDKMEFECLLKPQIQEKKQRVVNTNTPAKQLQFEYWQAYFEKCDELQSEMQINPAPRHYQYIGIGKKGVQIMQTVSTVEKYIATELSINNDKSIFHKLEEHKEQIEKALGTLEWHIKDGVDSCKIRQKIYFDISMTEIRDAKVEEHIKLAENFKKVFSKYL